MHRASPVSRIARRLRTKGHYEKRRHLPTTHFTLPGDDHEDGSHPRCASCRCLCRAAGQPQRHYHRETGGSEQHRGWRIPLQLRAERWPEEGRNCRTEERGYRRRVPGCYGQFSVHCTGRPYVQSRLHRGQGRIPSDHPAGLEVRKHWPPKENSAANNVYLGSTDNRYGKENSKLVQDNARVK